MDTPVGFITTPIKEIIFTLSFKGEVNNTHIMEFIKDPIIVKDFNVNRQKEELAAVKINEQSVQGFTEHSTILENSEKDKILRVRKGAVALYKVNEHEKYEYLLNALVEYWESLKSKVEDDLMIQGISLRYINFIECEEKETIKDLLNIYTNHPFSEEEINRNFSQIQLLKPDNIHPTPIEVNLVASNASHKGKKGVLFDIILNRKVEEEEEQTLNALFKGMRNIKNELFFKSITDRTINKYTKTNSHE